MNKIMENKSVTSNSDKINENKKRCKNQSTKKEKYNNEREQIIKELNENNEIYLYDLERNEEVKEYLKKNISNIQKYYKCGSWGYFSNDVKKGSGNEITLLRSIYKNNNYDILSKRKMNEREGEKKARVVLIFIKKTKK